MEAKLGTGSGIRRHEVEQLPCIQKVQIPFLGEEFESGDRVNLPVYVGRKVVEEWGDSVELDRMASVRGRNEGPLSNPEYLIEKRTLLLARPNVLDDRIRKYQVERLVVEGQSGIPLYLHIPILWENLIEDVGLLEARGGNLFGIWIKGMQEIVAHVLTGAIRSDLKHAPTWAWRKSLSEIAIELGLLVLKHAAEHPTRQRLCTVVNAAVCRWIHGPETSYVRSTGVNRKNCSSQDRSE